MRFIIYGAGAIGATIGARLQLSGQEVVLIARGAHAKALRERGLRLESHAGVEQLAVQVVEHPSELQFRADDLVVLATKTQDLTAALDELAAVAPRDLPVACAQNGVEAERLALRRFDRVYGIAVLVPAVYLEPGVVQVFSTPLTGVLDLGRYPHGRDSISEQLSAALRGANFGSEVRDDIQRIKYGKLLSNLGNAIEALSGPEARKGPVAELVREEALAVLRAANIDPDLAGLAKRAEAVVARPLAGQARPGGSSWQSLSRQTGNIESDYLNGEIVLLGRLHGVPTPVNRLLQRLANEYARKRILPGSLKLEALQQQVERELAEARHDTR
jgi:2-dehydropantoate 2-reductase